MTELARDRAQLLAEQRSGPPSGRPAKTDVREALSQTARGRDQITWLKHPVRLPGSRTTRVFGYDTRRGPPAWLATVIAEQEREPAEDLAVERLSSVVATV